MFVEIQVICPIPLDFLHKGSDLWWEHMVQQNGPQARRKEEEGESRVPQTPLRKHPNNLRASL